MVGSYANLGDVRKLSGGLSTTTMSDAEMQDFVDYGNAAIEGCTGLSNIPVTDSRYELMVQGAEYYASSAVRDHLRDKEKMATTHLERAEKICQLVINFNTEATATSSITSVSQGYKTHPLNPSGEYFSDRYIQLDEVVEP